MKKKLLMKKTRQIITKKHVIRGKPKNMWKKTVISFQQKLDFQENQAKVRKSWPLAIFWTSKLRNFYKKNSLFEFKSNYIFIY